MTRSIQTSALLLSLVLSLLAAGPALAREVSVIDANRTISVTGRAEIEFEPDQVILSSAVSEEDTSAKAAQTRAMEAASKALRVARDFGIDDDDLATDYVTLQQIVERERREGGRVVERVTRHRATTSVRIVLRDISRYDELLVKLLEAGVNRIDGIRFESEKRVEKTREARQAAMRAAREKAQYLLAELGQSAGPVLKVEEYSNAPDYRSANLERAAYADGGGGGGPSISPKKLVAQASVSAVFEIRPGTQEPGE